MESFTVTLSQARETKGTYVYESKDPLTHISSIYVKKSAFQEGQEAPKSIVLEVREIGG